MRFEVNQDFSSLFSSNKFPIPSRYLAKQSFVTMDSVLHTYVDHAAVSGVNSTFSTPG